MTRFKHYFLLAVGPYLFTSLVTADGIQGVPAASSINGVQPGPPVSLVSANPTTTAVPVLYPAGLGKPGIVFSQATLVSQAPDVKASPISTTLPNMGAGCTARASEEGLGREPVEQLISHRSKQNDGFSLGTKPNTAGMKKLEGVPNRALLADTPATSIVASGKELLGVSITINPASGGYSTDSVNSSSTASTITSTVTVGSTVTSSTKPSSTKPSTTAKSDGSSNIMDGFINLLFAWPVIGTCILLLV